MSDRKAIELRFNEKKNNFETESKTNFALKAQAATEIYGHLQNLQNKKLTKKETEEYEDTQSAREALIQKVREAEREKQEKEKEIKRLKKLLSLATAYGPVSSADHENKEEEKKNHKIKFGCNKWTCQGNSKTRVALKSIAKRHKLSKLDDPHVKLITLVLCNNSLLEVAQWDHRTAATFEGTDIVCQRLASDCDPAGKDMSKADELMRRFFTYSTLDQEERKNSLGDIVIMCNHHVRIDDIQHIINACAANGKSEEGNVEFRFNIYFDEFDKNDLKNRILNFLQFIHRKDIAYMINHIQLISGTTPPEILRDMAKIFPEAAKMLNIQKAYKEEGEELDYKTILNQEHIQHEGPQDPIDYVLSIAQNQNENEKLKNVFVPGKVYFIPSSYYTAEQERMAQQRIFREKGYWVLIINGKNKQFRSPTGATEELDLKKKELYDILREWRKNHPNEGLVITGNICIERGVTFLTNGFSFDYMIVSGAFGKKLYSLIQILGRGQGQSQYVGQFKLIMPQELYNRIKTFIEEDDRLCRAELEFYDADILSNSAFGQPKSLNKNDIAFEAFEGENAENNALARMNEILDGMKEVPDWEFKQQFRPTFNNIKNKKHKGEYVKEADSNGNWFYKERCLGKDNVGKYKIYSLEEMRNTRGEHSSGEATRTYKTHICYENVEKASTIRYVICYPKSHLEKIKSMSSNGVTESKNGD